MAEHEQQSRHNGPANGEPGSGPEPDPAGAGPGRTDAREALEQARRAFESFAGAHGYAQPGGSETGAPRDGMRCLELCPICRTADVLRASAPPELREQWHGVQREALLTMRSLIEHYLERVESRAPERGPQVEDIPID